MKWTQRLAACAISLGLAGQSAHAESALQAIEAEYADFNDAAGAVSLIDSDSARYRAGYDGQSRDAWLHQYQSTRAKLLALLRKPAGAELSMQDRRALQLMRAAVRESSAAPDSLAPVGRCADAQRRDLKLRPLQQALYACFAELANSLEFEGHRITRVAAFALLTRMEEPARRKALFMAFVPLWQAL